MKSQTNLPRTPRLLLSSWIAGCVVFLGIVATPINHGILRLIVVCAFPVLWLGAVWLLRGKKQYACGLFGLGIAAMIFALLPGRHLPPSVLQNEYIAQLKKYEGVPYVWGGENRLGIDCSGLVRRALIHAQIKLALTRANPFPLRSGWDLWWHDCTARALRDSYRGFTVPLFQSPSISSIDPNLLLPGDIAVTADGVHVLAYLGNRQWIEADPSVKSVLVVALPTDNPWFNVPVVVMRWTWLEERTAVPPPAAPQ